MVITVLEKLGQRVNSQLAIDRQEPVTHQQQAGDCSQFEMALGETNTKADTQHADHMIGTHVASENRSRYTEPANTTSSQEVVLRSLFLAADEEPDQHGTDQGSKKDDVIECRKIQRIWHVDSAKLMTIREAEVVWLLLDHSLSKVSSRCRPN